MLRARASRATDGSSTWEFARGWQRSGRRSRGDANGEPEQVSRGVDGAGDFGEGVGEEALRGAVDWLEEMEPAGVF